MSPPPPLLADRYELGETLGFGGMSEVFLARDLRLHRDVAIKVMRSDLARDPNFYLRFRRESQNAAALNHSTIVSVYDSGEQATDDGPVPYIVMEFVDGETLRDVVHHDGRVSPRQAMTWVADVCAALDYSHAAGIVHRDVKPANIMIDTAGAVKVMDFGIARAMNDNATMTQTAAVMGTAQYLSPEQARGETVDQRSDVYSLGCVLFELVTGQPPFTGESPVSVAYQHVREEPPTPSTLCSDISPELDAVILKAMAKNPDNRYQSAAEMRVDLERVLAGGRPVSPHVASVFGADEAPVTATITPPARRRRPLIIGAVATVVVLVLVTTAFVIWSSSGGSQDVQQATVPLVDGAKSDEAVTQLRQAGFEPVTEEQADNAVPVGQVIRTNPPGGTKADVGSTVRVAVSVGPNRVRVPAVKGKTPAEATAILRKAGFTVDATPNKAESTDELKDKVVGTDPSEGTLATTLGQIKLVVGTGPTIVPVPKVVGRTLSAARESLEQLGLKADVIEVDSDQPAGMVVNARPPEGENVKKGSTVTLSVSRGNQVRMPRLSGMTEGAAERALRDAGWSGTLEKLERRVLGDNIGKVLEQQPAPGGVIGKDTTVTLTIGRSLI